jgi:hypothetical protein
MQPIVEFEPKKKLPMLYQRAQARPSPLASICSCPEMVGAARRDARGVVLEDLSRTTLDSLGGHDVHKAVKFKLPPNSPE